MRFVAKRGLWKNTEDEILKAAVMKYGKNQWARVAALLPRKSATQCRHRWEEWLDPSVKKTEWTKEEEEQLRRLLNGRPCRWRGVGAQVGHTAAQCSEHYEMLLAAAHDKDAHNDPGPGPPLWLGRDPLPEGRLADPDGRDDKDEDDKATAVR